MESDNRRAPATSAPSVSGAWAAGTPAADPRPSSEREFQRAFRRACFSRRCLGGGFLNWIHREMLSVLWISVFLLVKPNLAASGQLGWKSRGSTGFSLLSHRPVVPCVCPRTLRRAHSWLDLPTVRSAKRAGISLLSQQTRLAQICVSQLIFSIKLRVLLGLAWPRSVKDRLEGIGVVQVLRKISRVRFSGTNAWTLLGGTHEKLSFGEAHILGNTQVLFVCLIFLDLRSSAYVLHAHRVAVQKQAHPTD